MPRAQGPAQGKSILKPGADCRGGASEVRAATSFVKTALNGIIGLRGCGGSFRGDHKGEFFWTAPNGIIGWSWWSFRGGRTRGEFFNTAPNGFLGWSGHGGAPLACNTQITCKNNGSGHEMLGNAAKINKFEGPA